MSHRTARIVVRGRVQGVGYRWFARDAAVALVLRGWVRNLRDGTVELEAQGGESALQQLIERLRRGPPAAKVAAVDVQWLPDPEPASARSAAAAGGAVVAARFEIRPTA